MKIKLVECFNHNIDFDPEFKLRYTTLYEASIKEMDNFTVSFNNSKEIREYFKDKVVQRGKKGNIVLIYKDHNDLETKMGVLYKKSEKKSNTKFLQNNIINYLKDSNLVENVQTPNRDDYYTMHKRSRMYTERVLHLMSSHPELYGVNLLYGYKTFPNRIKLARKYNPNKSQQEIYKQMVKRYEDLTSYVDKKEPELMLKDSLRRKRKEELINYHEKFFNSLRLVDNNYLHFTLRKMDSALNKYKDYKHFKNHTNITIYNDNVVKNTSMELVDPEYRDPFYFQTQGNNFDYGDLDYIYILEEEEKAHQLAMKRNSK